MDAEQKYFKEEKVERKAVQEKKNVQAEMTKIKKVVGALSTTFPDLMVKPEESSEVAIERFTALVNTL